MKVFTQLMRARLMIRAAAMIATALAFTLLLAGCAPAVPPDAAVTEAHGIVGAWRSNIRFSSGAFAAMKDLEFMYVFNHGGTMTESSNYDAAPPVPPAYGVWRAVGPREFEAKYLFYITAPPKSLDEITAGTGWGPAGHGVFVEHITLSEDRRTFTSRMDYTAFDTQGKAVEGGGKAEGNGTRIGF